MLMCWLMLTFVEQKMHKNMSDWPMCGFFVNFYTLPHIAKYKIFGLWSQMCDLSASSYLNPQLSSKPSTNCSYCFAAISVRVAKQWIYLLQVKHGLNE